MGFRLRLALFLVAILVSVQVLTWISVYEVTRRESIAEGERQLGTAADSVVNQLDDIAARVANSVQVLALDYALRAAIAQRDRATVLSALRNHGRRLGATRMLLLGLDGSVEADTGPAGDLPRGAFPFPGLLDAALTRPAAAVVALDGRAYWMVVVTVSAPEPIAQIAAGIPIDDRLLVRMQHLSPLPKSIELLASTDDGPWKVVAQGAPPVPISRELLRRGPRLPTSPSLVRTDGREYVALARRFQQSPGNVQMAVVVGYSLDQALAPFRSVTRTWLLLVLAALAIGAAGAFLIARGVSRPLEALADAAGRIAAGDYTPPPLPARRDELARLSAAFGQMTEAIREREARIRYQADHDAVTELPNRAAAEAVLQRELARSGAGAVLMVGLARMPDVVKTLGHAIGDELMREGGRRLRTVATGKLLARAADSRFLVWAPGANRTDAIALGLRIRDALAQPFQGDELNLDAGPVLGIALSPDHGDDARRLLQHAEVALFAAQRQEETLVVYDPDTDPHRPERLALMGELRAAIDGDGLALHYQPRLDLHDGRVDSVEGLVRWPHPRRGWVAPDQFVPLAEETGNVARLTRWVLAEGVAQLRRWNDAGRRMTLALNLSARDLDDGGLPQRVAELLAAHDVDSAQLVLEVTESAVMREPDTAIRVLRQLADRGIAIAIDDFGVGQSSLAYVRRLPVRELKIDRSFARQLGRDGDDQTIVRTIVELGHRLGLRVTCEGVEDSGALAFLRQAGCDQAQGYLIAEPMPAERLLTFLNDHNRQAG